MQNSKDKITRNAIDDAVKREVKHNNMTGSNKTETEVRKIVTDMAHKVEREKGAKIYE